jgi:hypothetical protein
LQSTYSFSPARAAGNDRDSGASGEQAFEPPVVSAGRRPISSRYARSTSQTGRAARNGIIARLTGADAVVDFDVPRSDVETESAEGEQALRDRFVLGAGQDQVEVGDADVVGPDVDLFHNV